MAAATRGAVDPCGKGASDKLLQRHCGVEEPPGVYSCLDAYLREHVVSPAVILATMRSICPGLVSPSKGLPNTVETFALTRISSSRPRAAMKAKLSTSSTEHFRFALQ